MFRWMSFKEKIWCVLSAELQEAEYNTARKAIMYEFILLHIPKRDKEINKD